jgi:hypothetical protein
VTDSGSWPNSCLFAPLYGRISLALKCPERLVESQASALSSTSKSTSSFTPERIVFIDAVRVG